MAASPRVNFGPAFLDQKDGDEFKRQIPLYNAIDPNLAGADLDNLYAKQRADEVKEKRGVSYATIDDAVNCIDHMAKVAGVDHVGIGSDFDGVGGAPPKGLEDVSRMPAVAALLHKRGYTESEVQKIMGSNFLRVIRAVVGN